MFEPLTDSWKVFVIRGVAAIILGVLALAVPGPTLAGLLIVFGAYAIVDGVFAVAAGLGMNGGPSWWLVLGGIAGIIVGIFTFASPGTTAVALVYLIAFWALVTGGAEIAAAIGLRKVIDNEWLLALSGVLSIAFGALLAFDANDGVLAILWLIGFYAIFFGVMSVGVGLRLRSVGKDVA